MTSSFKDRYLSFRRYSHMTAIDAYNRAMQSARLYNRFALWQSRQARAAQANPLSCRGVYQSIIAS